MGVTVDFVPQPPATDHHALLLPTNETQESVLWSPQCQLEDVEPEYEQDEYSDTQPGKMQVDAEEPDEEITDNEIDALGTEYDWDGSKLTAEQGRAIFRKFFAMHLKMIDLRSPQFYGVDSQCPSLSETIWPGVASYLTAEKVKRGYLDPEDLIERLRKLKPSDNFELRKYQHAHVSFDKSPIRRKAGVGFAPLTPRWRADQHWSLTQLIRSRMSSRKRKCLQQAQRQARQRWTNIKSDMAREIIAMPDLHLLRHIGESPGGTLFPRYLVDGLCAVLERAEDMKDDHEGEEYEKARKKREEAIGRWKENNGDTIPVDGQVYIYWCWPIDLVEEVDAIDREAIRRTWERYMTLLREAEKEMQMLVAFWRECGLVTGQKTPPVTWWLSSLSYERSEVREHLLWPPYLREQLDAFDAQFGAYSDKTQILQLIEISRWKEAMMNHCPEPTPLDTPFPQSLVDELGILWKDTSWYEVKEEKFIERISQWRKMKYELRASPQPSRDDVEELAQRASRQGSSTGNNLPRKSTSGSVMAPEEMRQLREKLSRLHPPFRKEIALAEENHVWQGRLRSTAKLTIAEGWKTWHHGIRPRQHAIGALRGRLRASERQTGMPKGIAKRYRTVAKEKKDQKKQQQTVTKIRSTTPTTPMTDMSSLSDTKSNFSETSIETYASAVTTGRMKDRRQSRGRASAIQPRGIQKTYSDKRIQSRKLLGAIPTTNQGQWLALLTPPQS